MLDEVVCPDCDDTEVLPIVSFADADCDDPEINKSEIIAIYVALPSAADFTDEGDPEEWAARLSQTATPPAPVGGGTAAPVKDLIRKLTVIADKPASTPTTKAISNNRTITIDQPNVLNVTIDEVNDSNYDFARATQCGTGLGVKAWYETAGGYLYGGKGGLKSQRGFQKPTLKLQIVLDRGTDAIETITGTLTYNNLKTEARVRSPFV